MRGYRNRPEQTAEAIDADGWLRTGDIARSTRTATCTIVDRKKELIINAAGKNMSPANIEATLKAASPLIGQACVIGDARPYNIALIVLDADFAPAWASSTGSRTRRWRRWRGRRGARGRAGGRRRRQRASSRAWSRSSASRIVEGDWLPGGDELTPTMKLKRKPIGEKYAAEIERAVRRLERLVHWGRWPPSGRSTSARCRSAAARPSPCRR